MSALTPSSVGGGSPVRMFLFPQILPCRGSYVFIPRFSYVGVRGGRGGLFLLPSPLSDSLLFLVRSKRTHPSSLGMVRKIVLIKDFILNIPAISKRKLFEGSC